MIGLYILLVRKKKLIVTGPKSDESVVVGVSCVLVIHLRYYCIFLPDGQATSLHVVVSERGIVLEDAHFVPLFTASDIFSLNNWIPDFRTSKDVDNCTLTWFWCLLRMRQSKKTTNPTDRHRSRLKVNES